MQSECEIMERRARNGYEGIDHDFFSELTW